MTFPILGGNSAVGGYAIDNSLRFNDGDSPTLSRTPASAGNRQTWTVSFWIKRADVSTYQGIFSTYTGTASINTQGGFRTDNKFEFYDSPGTGSYNWYYLTNRVFRDVSAWYHFVLAVDTTQATASDRVKIYVNGVQETSFSSSTNPSLNNNTADWNNNVINYIGKHSTLYYDGYLAEFHNIDGQALSPTDFGEFDEDSGIWKPIEYTGTYGTNGFYLDFENSGSLGADQSGNGNNFTPTNLASTDQTTDTPTNNFATWNPLDLDKTVTPTLSEGNTKLSQPPSGTSSNSNFGVPSGQWYFECKMTTRNNAWLGIVPQNLHSGSTNLFTASNTIGIYAGNPNLYKNGSLQGSLGGGLSNGDILMIAFDIDNGNFYVGKNGLWNDGLGGGFDQADFSNATAHSFTVKTGDNYVVGTVNGSGSTSYVLDINFGNPSFSISSGNSDDNGYGNFEYAPPSGYLALCTKNLASELTLPIDDGSEYFNTVLYTGDGSNPRSLTGVGFQPDFTWIKNRTDTWGHGLADSTRGGGKTLITNSTVVEQTNYTWGYVDSFDSDGFTVDDGVSGDDFVNQTSDNYVSWNWLANGGTTSSNTDGSITATLQSNATSGFAIATWSGTGTAGTIGHGLGVQPKLVIVKRRNSPESAWLVQHGDLPSNFVTFLNRSDTGGETDSTSFNGTYPTSSVFSVGTHAGTNQSGGTYVGYIFAPITGYSAMGKYTGNGSDDGTFIYTGFRPAFVMMKKTSGTGNWNIFDSTRDIDNVGHHLLFANLSNAEETSTSNRDIDFLSNGFKQREGANQDTNGSGGTYIYMAFAENPFVSSTGIPVTAR